MYEPTHLQELIEQAEGISVSQMVITQPVPKFADITRFNLSLFITAGLPITVATLPLQLFCSVSAEAALQPTGKQNMFTSSTCLHNLFSDEVQFESCEQASPPAALQEIKNTAHSRHSELKDVVESLFEQHDNSHLDEEVCQTTTGMALQDKQNTSEGLYCGADMLYNWLKIQ